MMYRYNYHVAATIPRLLYTSTQTAYSGFATCTDDVIVKCKSVGTNGMAPFYNTVKTYYYYFRYLESVIDDRVGALYHSQAFVRVFCTKHLLVR